MSVRPRRTRKRPTMPLVPGRSGATMLRQGCEWDVAAPADGRLASAWATATDATSPWNVASRSAGASSAESSASGARLRSWYFRAAAPSRNRAPRPASASPRRSARRSRPTAPRRSPTRRERDSLDPSTLRRTHRADSPSRLVPDGRRPGPLLHRGVEPGGAAVGEIRARLCGQPLHETIARERIDAEVAARIRAPAAGRILEHAGIIEGGLSRVERVVFPDRAELAGAG